MTEEINENVTLVTLFNKETKETFPRKMLWKNREYLFKKLNYYHKFKKGLTVIHIFHLTDGHIDFRLRFDSNNLLWTLEEVCDGTAD